MEFPIRRGSPLRTLAVAAVAFGCIVAAAPSAQADDPTPVLHHVKYTVFSETPFRNAEIYYRDTDPPNFADYSHNPYVFSPNVEADVGPNQMWTQDVMLANPDQWAMVTAGSLDSPQRPNFHCVLAIDGNVVVTNQGPKGALCSVRNW
jgi:cytochrome c1